MCSPRHMELYVQNGTAQQTLPLEPAPYAWLAAPSLLYQPLLDPNFPGFYS